MRANCIICSDFFDETHPISAAACGHTYHSSCLSLWIGQSRTCPQCRTRVTQKDIQILYFNFCPSSVTNSELENEVLNLKAQLSAKNIELQACKKEKEDTVAFVRLAEKRASELQQAAYKHESEISELRIRVKSFTKLEAKLLKLEQINVAITNDLQTLNNVQIIVKGTQKDVENILQEYNDKSETAKQLATYCTCLKRELQKVIESKNKLVELNSKLKRENGLYAAKVKFYEDAMVILPENVNALEKGASVSDEKKTPLCILGQNNSPVSNKPSSSLHKTPAEDMSSNISPLTVPFKSKFNMCIKTSNVTYKRDASYDSDIKFAGISSLSVTKKNNDNTIVRTGYNGLGGHTKFIASSQFKKFKNFKK